MHLRAKGAAVYGFGAQKTPEPFVNACSRFLYLDKLRPILEDLGGGRGVTEPWSGEVALHRQA